MTTAIHRATTVRPKADVTLQPLYDEIEMPDWVDAREANESEEVVFVNGGEGSQVENKVVDTDARPVWEKEWEEVRTKVEGLTDRVASTTRSSHSEGTTTTNQSRN